MKQLPIVRDFIGTRFPAAEIAIVAGSTARGTRTATSDIDLLLIGPELMFAGGPTSLVGTYAFGGEIFEVFAYTVDAFETWARRAADNGRPTIAHMLVDGVVVRDSAALADLRERWRRVIEAGPAVDAHELRTRRYTITDVVDDLRDAADPLERRLIAGLLFQYTAELMLLSNGRWIGAGKYLPRRLREWNPQRADRLAGAFLSDDPAALVTAVEAELELAGGRMQVGFVR